MPLFIRWGDLTDNLVGKTARGKRPFIRWPKDLADLKKACAGIGVGNALIATGLALIAIPPILEMMFGFSFGAAAPLAAIAGGVVLWILAPNLEEKETERVKKASETMEPLLGKDPYLDLRAAAYLTVGAMPKWLQEQMGLGRSPGWRRARLAGEPYTVGRAGFDYLELMRKIEQDPQVYMWECEWSFRGKSLPGIDCRLPDPLKDAVVEIVLLLSSLPDSGEEPDEETEDAVMYTLDRLATIDGVSFTEAMHRVHEEAEDEKKAAEDKRKADYNSEIRRALYAASSALDAKRDTETDERYKSIQRGMKRLSKISEESGCAAESAASQLAEAASLTR